MNRIRLTFARNTDGNTKRYRIFRSLSPNVLRKSTLVMEVEHPPMPNPIAVEDDRLQRLSGFTYQCAHIHLMSDPDDYPVQIIVNGIDAEELGLTWTTEFQDGLFHFSGSLLESDEVIASYFIDAIQIIDSDEVTHPADVTYYGPTARDRTEPTIPANLALLPDIPNGRVILSWADSFAQGQTYYYRVEAIDENGNFSSLSTEHNVFLSESMDSQAYLVESSSDGTNWFVVSRQTEATYFEYGLNRQPPNPPMSPGITRKDGVNKLTWLPGNTGVAGGSGRYRVSAISANDVISSPSLVVGPVYLAYPAVRYVVRRKQWDGSYPTFSGDDAITVGTVLAPGTSFQDDNTLAGVLAYSIFAVDADGLHSFAATLKIEVQ